MASRYTVALRVCSDELAPDAITERIGKSPHLAKAIGDPRGLDRRWTTNVWQRDFPTVDGVDFCSALRAFVAELALSRARLESLPHSTKKLLWCAQFSVGPETTVALPADVLRAIGQLGVDLEISVYAVDETPS